MAKIEVHEASGKQCRYLCRWLIWFHKKALLYLPLNISAYSSSPHTCSRTVTSSSITVINVIIQKHAKLLYFTLQYERSKKNGVRISFFPMSLTPSRPATERWCCSLLPKKSVEITECIVEFTNNLVDCKQPRVVLLVLQNYNVEITKSIAEFIINLVDIIIC